LVEVPGDHTSLGVAQTRDRLRTILDERGPTED